MLKRTITGIVILILTAGFIALREVSPYFFDAFVLVLIYGSVVEMLISSKFSDKKTNKVLVLLYPAILATIYLVGALYNNKIFYWMVLQICAMLLMFALLMATELIKNAVKRKNGDTTNEASDANSKLLNETKYSLQIMLYPTTLLGFLFGINHMGLNRGYIGIILVFAVTMMTDIVAYLFGATANKIRKGNAKKMAPEISPNKTIVGMIGGLFGGIVAAGLSYLFFVHLGWLGNVFETVSLAKTISLFVILGVVGTFLTQFGDLVASAYKRKVGIKDFGNIFPGHGGFMDRVDGLMFTAALVFILFALFI